MLAALHCRGYVLFLTYQTTRAGGGLQDVWQVWVLLLPCLQTRVWCLLRRLHLLLQGLLDVAVAVTESAAPPTCLCRPGLVRRQLSFRSRWHKRRQ